MAVDKPDLIDAVGIDRTTEEAVLTIADQLGWSDVSSHLSALQEKLNRYLGFIESGEILESYPLAKGRQLRINVMFRFAPPEESIRLLEQADEVISAAGFSFSWRVYPGSP